MRFATTTADVPNDMDDHCSDPVRFLVFVTEFILLTMITRSIINCSRSTVAADELCSHPPTPLSKAVTFSRRDLPDGPPGPILQSGLTDSRDREERVNIRPNRGSNALSAPSLVPSRKKTLSPWLLSKMDASSSTKCQPVRSYSPFDNTAMANFHAFDMTSSTFADYPIPGRTTVYDESETIDLENVPLNGGTLIKTLVVSIDPYLRRMMVDPKTPSSFVSVVHPRCR